MKPRLKKKKKKPVNANVCFTWKLPRRYGRNKKEKQRTYEAK